MRNSTPYEMKTNTKAGFSLVEISIVLVVVGIMLFGASQLYSVTMEKTRLDTTNDTLDAIDRALKLYYKTHKDLPCPADGTLAITAPGFGIGRENNDGEANHSCNYDNYYGNAGLESATVVITAYGGVVPVKTLNLPNSYMFDGWGNRINYVVSSKCVNSLASAVTSCKLLTASGPSLSVYDNSDNTTGTDADDLRTGVATYVTVSFGKNGYGAFRKEGGATRLPGLTGITPQELENAHVTSAGANTTAAAAPNKVFRDDFIRDWKSAETGSGVAGQDGTYFDDIVRWKTQSQLAQD